MQLFSLIPQLLTEPAFRFHKLVFFVSWFFVFVFYFIFLLGELGLGAVI